MVNAGALEKYDTDLEVMNDKISSSRVARFSRVKYTVMKPFVLTTLCPTTL
jgi:hypothetical protein